MVKLDKIYTKGGDKGQTSLGDGSRIAKHALRMHAIGAVDEVNAQIGIARASLGGTQGGEAMDKMLAAIQNDLFDLGADLARPQDPRNKKSALRIAPEQVARLEAEIDSMNARLLPLTSFILPGGHIAAAHVHAARGSARRCERIMVALAEAENINPPALQFINRLSDHLFVMARAINANGKDDVLWVPGKNRPK